MTSRYTIAAPEAGSKKWAWRMSKRSGTFWFTLNGVRGPDAGDEGMGVAGQMEIGFRPHRLDDFYHGFHRVAPAGCSGKGKAAGNVFRANAEDDSLADVSSQRRGGGVVQLDGEGVRRGSGSGRFVPGRRARPLSPTACRRRSSWAGSR